MCRTGAPALRSFSWRRGHSIPQSGANISPPSPLQVTAPVELIEAQNHLIGKDFAKWVADNEAPFFTPETITETRNWIKGMMLSVTLPVALECRRTIGMTDTRADLAQLDLPTLILQGDKDSSAPLSLTGVKTQELIKGSRLIVYEGAPHGLTLTHRERLICDILYFIAR